MLIIRNVLNFNVTNMHRENIRSALFSSKSELLLRILDLLFGPGSVGEVLLDLQLSRRVHGLTGSVQRSSITIGSSLSRPFVTYNTLLLPTPVSFLSPL